MNNIFVDPDSLTAAATVANRQHDHVTQVSSYISGPCSQFGAFTGVLDIFEGNYREAVTAALKGMDDGVTIADKVQDCLIASRKDFLDTDREVYELFRTTYGEVVDFPPYDAPGSGNSVPGDGASVPSGPDEDDDGLPDIPGGPSMPSPIDKGLDRFHESRDDVELPGYVNPSDYAKDAVLSQIRDAQTREQYLELREQGLTPQEAYDQSTASVDDRASNHVYQETERRAEDAYNGAYDDAIADGKSPEDAERAGQDAAGDQRSSDAADHQSRNRALDDGRTLYDGYNEVNDTIDNLNDLKDNLEQLDQTTDDLEDYGDYEGQDEDTSAQDWGNK